MLRLLRWTPPKASSAVSGANSVLQSHSAQQIVQFGTISSNSQRAKTSSLPAYRRSTKHNKHYALPKRVILVRHGQSEGNIDGRSAVLISWLVLSVDYLLNFLGSGICDLALQKPSTPTAVTLWCI